MAILAPAIFWQVFWLVADALGAVLWAGNPWNTFGPSPVLNRTALNELASRPQWIWALRMAPACACALIWCLVHVRRRRLVPLWVFVLAGIAIPFLVIVVGSPVYAWMHDRQKFEWAFGFVIGGVLSFNPGAVVMGLVSLAAALAESYRWVITSFDPFIQQPVPLFYCTVYVYLPDVVATWFAAWLLNLYARRCGPTDRGLAASFVRDFLGLFVGTAMAIGRLAGFGERPATAAQQVARAVARPWLIPAGCALLFIAINGIFNLFPIALALAALAAYAVTRAIWSLADAFGFTRMKIGGALTGAGSAFLIAQVCFTLSAQAWLLRLKLDHPPQLFVLVSYLPVFIAMFASIITGARQGWRTA